MAGGRLVELAKSRGLLRGSIPDGGKRPVIVVNDRELRDKRAEALAALQAINDPPFLFVRGAVLTRFRTTETGAPMLEIVTEPALRGHLADAADWRRERTDARGNVRYEIVSPPRDVVEDILSQAELPFPPIRGIVEAPVFGKTGRLVTEPGYNPDAWLWYHKAPGLEVPAVPEKPSRDDVERAKALLLEDLMGDFPFVDEASRAHALCALLLPFVREMIDGPTPLHLIDKPAPGSGGSLLADAITIPATGRPAHVMTESRDEEEWRKRITSALIDAPTFVMIDNIRRRLDSSALAAALTASIWTDRTLGRNRMVLLPVRVVWLGTGNNVAASNEIARRTCWIRLDPKVDQPWRRTGFRHPDLRGWAQANRGQLIWAALVLVQAWIAAGRPQGGQTLGNFEAWARTMGGILDVIGVPGFLGNLDQFYAQADEEMAEWRAFVHRWWDAFGPVPVRVEQLWQLAVDHELIPAVLGDKGERSQRIRLGKALARMRERIIGDFRIAPMPRDGHLNQAVYCLQKVEAGERAGTDDDADAFDDDEAGDDVEVF
ncbi:hypothetical protein [Thermaerobacter composti]|uniref:Uncharacterized protein n=1 Tax=Thermaerobacter composti TaxID=554949 RepID=A0ABZ0QRT1_9FIRM|nr:hypothetical protein [Thermaerobacter composti]WPD20203.1 hypothetical protein Q5761_06115 [Thermaerobacter composti]